MTPSKTMIELKERDRVFIAMSARSASAVAGASSPRLSQSSTALVSVFFRFQRAIKANPFKDSGCYCQDKACLDEYEANPAATTAWNFSCYARNRMGIGPKNRILRPSLYCFSYGKKIIQKKFQNYWKRISTEIWAVLHKISRNAPLNAAMRYEMWQIYAAMQQMHGSIA
jgi:hypothetical protein